MGTLRDTPFNNPYGKGKQQEYIADDGKKYIIRDTPFKNPSGDGYQKEIVEQPSYSGSESEKWDPSIWYAVSALLGILTFCAFGTSGVTIISIMFTISTIMTLLIGIIKAPHTMLTIIKFLIGAAILIGIVTLPFLPGILESARF